MLVVFNEVMNTSHKDEIRAYLHDNPIAILSTVDAHGNPHGAALYIYAVAANEVYFVTKKETRKFKNLHHSNEVSITVVDPNDNSTLQADGRAEIVGDAGVIEMVMEKMARMYVHGGDWLPPLAKIKAGPYEVIKVMLHNVRLSRFKGARPGDEHMFVTL